MSLICFYTIETSTLKGLIRNALYTVFQCRLTIFKAWCPLKGHTYLSKPAALS